MTITWVQNSASAIRFDSLSMTYAKNARQLPFNEPGVCFFIFGDESGRPGCRCRRYSLLDDRGLARSAGAAARIASKIGKWRNLAKAAGTHVEP
jgi:hypothetical protein